MRYLLNLPLFIAFLAIARAFTVASSGLTGGGDASIGAGYEMLFETVITWLMLAVILGASGGVGGFRWPRVRGFGGALVGLAAFVGLFVISLAAIGIAMELSAASRWGIGQMASARLVAFGLPFLVVLYGTWIVNAPMPSRDSLPVHAGALGAAGLLCVIALIVMAREMAREGQEAQVRVAVENREQEEKANEMRRDLAKLTDANSLFEWDAFLGDNVPDDVKIEARRRVVARPQFEAELAEALDNVGNYPWSEQALALILILPFRPSPVLADPARHAIAGFANRMTRESKDVTYDGDKYIDRYYSYRLDDMLRVAERMAKTAGADLGDSIDAVVSAVALYPKSDSARTYPAKAAASKKRIAQILAAGRK
jgi:hypothetical protein